MIFKKLIITSLIVSSSFSNNIDRTDDLSLENVINLSISNDTWLLGNKYKQNSIEVSSIAAGTYADPKITIGAANIPTDTFDLNQEAMTQLKVGVSQMFPRGNSLEIKKEQLKLKASQFPFQREDRKSKLTVKISQLWLDAYKAQESIVLIEKNRSLFEQLSDVAESSYSTAVGKTRQQDIIRAQLELTRLDDKLTVLKQKRDIYLLSLSQWMYEFSEDQLVDEIILKTSNLILPNILPMIKVIDQSYINNNNSKELLNKFKDHPSIRNIEQKIKSVSKGILLSKEKFKPQFGINTSYATRDDDLKGKDRADLFSIGFTFDVPLFTDNKQNNELKASILRTKAVKTEKVQQLRKLLSSYETIKVNLLRLQDRKDLYLDKLLPQISEQAEASLTAYTNDDGDFAEVVRSRISELNAKIDLLNINVDIKKTIVKYNYLFSEKAKDILQIAKNKGENL
jgi:outer membrane protein TolC